MLCFEGILVVCGRIELLTRGAHFEAERRFVVVENKVWCSPNVGAVSEIARLR